MKSARGRVPSARVGSRWVAENPVERFWSKVSRTAPGEPGCWEWIGSLGPNGYGQVRWDGTMRRANRVSWEIASGAPPPPGMFVCHRCDNPRCVRPEHLFLGTARDNMRDASRKQRVRGGRDGSTGRLGPQGAAAVRAEHANGVAIRALARTFQVSQRAVQKAVRGDTWRDAPTDDAIDFGDECAREERERDEREWDRGH